MEGLKPGRLCPWLAESNQRSDGPYLWLGNLNSRLGGLDGLHLWSDDLNLKPGGLYLLKMYG